MICSRNSHHLEFYLVVMSLYNIVEASVLTLTMRTVLIYSLEGPGGRVMVDSSIDCVSTCNNGLTLRITVLPFSSVREDSTVHCTLQCTIQGWVEGSVGMRVVE